MHSSTLLYIHSSTVVILLFIFVPIVSWVFQRHPVGSPYFTGRKEMITLNMESRGQEEPPKLDAIFQTIEDFLSEQRNPGKKRGGKIKSVIGNHELASVFTPEWRKTVICRTEGIPMSHLIEGFERYYHSKRICRGRSDSKALVEGAETEDGRLIFLPADVLENIVARIRRGTSDKDVVQGAKPEDGQLISLPSDLLENIFLRLRLPELLASRRVRDDWAAVYDCKYFQAIHNRTEACIVINNHNLDMWAFSVMSKSWSIMNVPCDWDTLGLKTLGIKASCEGLFLVARSDMTLYVVNPLTAQVKSLPNIYPYTYNRIDLLKCLIVHGTAEMQTENNTGHYRVYLFGNWQNFLRLAQYNSKTGLWALNQISLYGNSNHILSWSFPSPLRSYCYGNIIHCFSATCRYLQYICDDPVNIDDNAPSAKMRRVFISRIPATVETEYSVTVETDYRSGETCNNASLPTVVPYDSGRGQILVGRVNGDTGSQVFGRLPIVRHSNIGLWEFNQAVRQWSMIDTIRITLPIEDMIKSSEGTDFLVVGDGSEEIWLMLKGSDSMLHYKLRTKEWELESGCPGGGYMDANLHWKSVFEHLKLDAKVSAEE